MRGCWDFERAEKAADDTCGNTLEIPLVDGATVAAYRSHRVMFEVRKHWRAEVKEHEILCQQKIPLSQRSLRNEKNCDNRTCLVVVDR